MNVSEILTAQQIKFLADHGITDTYEDMADFNEAISDLLIYAGLNADYSENEIGSQCQDILITLAPY